MSVKTTSEVHLRKNVAAIFSPSGCFRRTAIYLRIRAGNRRLLNFLRRSPAPQGFAWHRRSNLADSPYTPSAAPTPLLGPCIVHLRRILQRQFSDASQLTIRGKYLRGNFRKRGDSCVSKRPPLLD